MQKIKDLCDTIFPSIDGWCAVEKAEVMIDLVEETTPSLILELGVFIKRIRPNTFPYKIVFINV
jgi:hypothetical protein